MANKQYSRKDLRKHYDTNIYVSNDGRHAERDIQIRSTGKDSVLIYEIYHEESGRTFIHDKYKGSFFIDDLVLTCYFGRPPQDGKKYYPHHKDGKMYNSHIANLEWREETAASIAQYQQLEKECWYKNRKIKAFKDGTIKQAGKTLHFADSLYDRDLDWTFHYTEPKVHYEEKNRYGRMERRDKDVAEIFEDFGFIQGDKSELSNPAILHINNDYMDFASDNLEWVETKDPRYEEFKRVSHEKKMEKDHEANYWVSPGSWNVLYRGNEPYQDWADKKRN